MASEKPPGFWTYTAMLGLISVLLSVVGYLSISRFDGVERSITKLVESSSKTEKSLASMQATIDAWAKQNFVPRDLFDALKAEYERRLGAMEARIK